MSSAANVDDLVYRVRTEVGAESRLPLAGGEFRGIAEEAAQRRNHVLQKITGKLQAQ
jgi:hypothetical protein